MSTQQQFELKIERIQHDSEEFLRFLDAWCDEIEKIFPDFAKEDAEFATIFLLKVNAQPAGLVIYEIKGDEVFIELDYLVQKFRDLGVGKTFFQTKNEDFMKGGFERIVALTFDQVHINYLKSIGFKKSMKHESRYEYDLK